MEEEEEEVFKCRDRKLTFHKHNQVILGSPEAAQLGRLASREVHL